MQRTCVNSWCKQRFDVTEGNLAFYEKVSPAFNGKKELIPPPTQCPACRQQRRLAFRNERTLYRRTCDLTGKPMISMYAPETNYKVYAQESWWSDAWDPLATGRAYDPARPFFKQFDALFHEAPRISLINMDPDNAEYCNFALRNKNSYLLFTCECQDSFYCNRSFGRDLCDCSSVQDCELCYDAVDCDHCYHCVSIQNCSNCSGCSLGYNLRGCTDCFGCCGLVNASYRIFNEQYSPEDFGRIVREKQANLAEAARAFAELQLTLPQKYMDAVGTEGCTGNAIHHSKNSRECFEVMNVEDCTYVCNATHMKDAMDVNNDDNSELVYEAVGSETNSMHAFNDICWFNRDVLYSSLCFRCESCFGCIGLKHKKYCILNKQYTKEEYERLVPTIIERMRRDGEWGEFFPVSISPFAYNETSAQEYFPLTKNDVQKQGWAWRDESRERPDVQRIIAAAELPGSIEEIPDDIINWAIACEATGKLFRIIKPELAFYRKMNLEVPRHHPDERHRRRMAKRNPRKLWERVCANCHKPIATSYAPERPEKILCEECYLREVY
jgi:hypothetical protein